MAKIKAEAYTKTPNMDAIEAYSGIEKTIACAGDFGFGGGGYDFMDRGVFYDNPLAGANSAMDNGLNRFGGDNCYNPYMMLPRMQELIICKCMRAYDRVGIVRNVIDLMGDFACQGINLVHPNKQIERFYRKWFKKVHGKDRCERFLNMLYRCGNVVVRRFDAKLPSVSIDEWRKAYGKDMDDEFAEIQAKKNVIPSRYVFYNPMAIHVIGGELGAFMGKAIYAIKMSAALKTLAASYGQLAAQPGLAAQMGQLPKELLQAVKNGSQFLPIDQDKISAYHYKKDDWLVWANPMLYSVLADLYHYEKLKMADNAALDGCISNVRLWNLGVLDGPDNSIFPTRAAIDKLRNTLAHNVSGGTLDLVWGPELKFTESNSQAYHFLGPEKYQVTLSNIYTGLGIPPSMTGSATDGGFTNNYMSMKTLIERLEYGRDVLETWLNVEIERVQKAMGFRFPAQVTFDQMILSDEAAEKALLIQLIDRNLISADTVRGKFDIPSDIEKIRIKRDHAEHEGGTMPPKAGQFNNPQTDHELKKLAMQRGSVTPSQVGLDLPEKQEGEQTPLEQQHQHQMELSDKNNQSKIAQQKFDPSGPNGRPKNKKDSIQRKKKRVLPKTKGFVDIQMWAGTAQKAIAEILTPIILQSTGKKNVRALSAAEFEQLEFLKFDILTKFQPFDKVSQERVYSIIDTKYEPDQEIHDNMTILIASFINTHNREPSLEEKKSIQCAAFAAKFEESED